MKNLILFFLTVWLFAGCSWFDSSNEMTQSAQELVSDGSSYYNSGDYSDAVKAFTDLKDWYPFSKYAILAELKIADSYYHLEEFDDAIFNYEEFEKMHPKNEAVPYVIYQTGLCWFKQLDSVDRDRTPAKNSLVQFRRLINQFPDNEYAKKAKKNIKKCMENLSGHELYVANYYMKTKEYKAALKRYEYLVEQYPGSKESKEALNKLAECRTLIDKKE